MFLVITGSLRYASHMRLGPLIQSKEKYHIWRDGKPRARHPQPSMGLLTAASV